MSPSNYTNMLHGIGCQRFVNRKERPIRACLMQNAEIFHQHGKSRDFRFHSTVSLCYRAEVGEDLKDVLLRLYEAGAEDVPADEISWDSAMTPAIVVALNMGYMRYREKKGIKHFYLTSAGYSKIGIPPFSASRHIVQTIRRWLGLRVER